MKTRRRQINKKTARKTYTRKCGGTRTSSQTKSQSRATKSSRPLTSSSATKRTYLLNEMEPISDITDVDSSPASESEFDDKVYYEDGLLCVRDTHFPGIKGTQVNLCYRTDPNDPTKALIDENPVDIRFKPQDGTPYTTGVLTESTRHTGKKPTGAAQVRDPKTGKKVYINSLQADNAYIVYTKEQKKWMEKALKKYFEKKYNV